MPRRTVSIAGRPLSLDARPDRLDLRDRPFQPQLRGLAPRWPSDAHVERLLTHYVEAGLVRDQGEDGACTGFGLAAVIDYLEFVSACDGADLARANSLALRRCSSAMLYELARMYDEWPGEDYEGSSCRGALKGWHRHGVCREELWPYRLVAGKHVFEAPIEHTADRTDVDRNWDVDALNCALGVYYRIDARSIVDMQAAILQVGAIYCSADAHEGWDLPERRAPRSHADLPVIDHILSPREPGGHAFAIVGYNEHGFVVQNSWGKSWGAQGFGILPYIDWVAHGQDAWVFTLGVPGATTAPSKSDRNASRSRTRSPRYISTAFEASEARPVERPIGLVGSSDSLEQRYRDVPAKFRPLSSDEAYRHAVVLDRGFPVRNDLTRRDAYASLECVGYELPRAWLDANDSNKLLIYAHGGLTSEAHALERVRALAPYALEHGIYPLFITWRSGPLETVSDLVEELFAKIGAGARGTRAAGFLDRIVDQTDRMLEPLLRGAGGALWNQMKANAKRASIDPPDGFQALAAQLVRLKDARPNLECHFIGHSAGSLVAGTMFDRMRATGKLKAHSLRLLGAACTIDFALRHFKPAVESGFLQPKHWHIHNLSDANELKDHVGPYRKSLLYLVSRSFESVHKTALLGFDRAFDPELAKGKAEDDVFGKGELDTVRAFQSFWKSLGVDETNRVAHVLSAASVSCGHASIASSHGCFDNSVEVLGDALGYIVDSERPKRVKIHRLDY